MNERHRRKRLDALRYALALPRSVWYNLRWLPLKQAVKLPILVSHRTIVENVSGRVELECDRLRMGIVKIGFNTCQASDFGRDHTRLNIRGVLHVCGDCAIGAGSSIEVSESGVLMIGAGFNLGPRSLVVCHKSVVFGSHVLTSWNCTFMDCDQHVLVDDGGRRCNDDREVTIGDSVWIGCHVLVPKGVSVTSQVTVGAGSVLRGHYDERCTIVAGNPAVVVRHGVNWDGQ